MLNKGEDVNQRERNYTPVFMAILFNQLEATRLLLERGADLNPYTDILFFSLIGIDEGPKSIKFTRLLLDHDADMEVYHIDCLRRKSLEGTRLIYTARSKHRISMRILLQRGTSMKEGGWCW